MPRSPVGPGHGNGEAVARHAGVLPDPAARGPGAWGRRLAADGRRRTGRPSTVSLPSPQSHAVAAAVARVDRSSPAPASIGSRAAAADDAVVRRARADAVAPAAAAAPSTLPPRPVTGRRRRPPGSSRARVGADAVRARAGVDEVAAQARVDAVAAGAAEQAVVPGLAEERVARPGRRARGPRRRPRRRRRCRCRASTRSSPVPPITRSTPSPPSTSSSPRPGLEVVARAGADQRVVAALAVDLVRASGVPVS